VLFAQHNTIKTAPQPSKINFYFVTSFYSLYDICMVAQVHRRVGCDDVTSEVSAAMWTVNNESKCSMVFPIH